MKKILLIILIAFISIGAVSAVEDNATSPIEDVDVSYGEIGNQVLTNERHDVYMYNLPEECELNEFNLYIDNKSINYHGVDVERGTSFRHIEGYYNYNFTIGKHSLKFEFVGNKYYQPYSRIIEFTATPAIIQIPDTVVQGIYAHKNVFVYLADNVTGKFEIYADNSKFFSRDIGDSRRYNYPIDSLSFGSHDIEVTAGHVKEKKTVDVTYILDVQVYDNEVVVVTVPYDVEKALDFFIDGKKYTYVVGGVKVTGIGKHYVSVTYPGDAKYPKKTVNLTFEIKSEPKIIAPNAVYTFYKDTRAITLTVYELSSVKITFNSVTKTYNPVNGKITFKVPTNIKPGTYTLEASSNLVYAQSKITIKHLLTLNSATVKKSAKSLTLQATLKNKNPIKNTYLTFKFNGKLYKAKTNYKGIAKVTIPKSILKNLKVGKKITYQATYGKDTVKKTVTVKK